MTVPKANQRAVNKYVKANYDRINVTMPKGEKEIIQGYAVAQGESVNGFIVRAIRDRMERNSGGTPSETAGKCAETAQGVGVVSLPSKAVRTAQEAAETGELLEQEAGKLLDAAKAQAEGIVQDADREAGKIRQTVRQEVQAMQTAAEARIKAQEDAAAADRAKAAQELAAAQAAREAAEAGDLPFPTKELPRPVDKAKAAEEPFDILGSLGTIDLDQAKCERLGIMYLPPDILETAQKAAEAAGQPVANFVARAVRVLAQMDQERRERAAAAILPAVGSPVPSDRIGQTVKANMPGICSLINEGERRGGSKGRSKPSQMAEATLRDLFKAGYTVEEVQAAAQTAAQEGYTGSWYDFPKYCAKLYGRKWVDPR